MFARNLVHVAGLLDVAASVAERAVAFFVFGVCAVPEFASVEGVCVDVVQCGFEVANVCVCCRVVFADFFVPFVVYEASRIAAHADGDGHCLEVADVFGEVCLLFVGEAVPCVGECDHGGEVCGPGGEEVGCGCDLVDDDVVGGEDVRHDVCFFLVVFCWRLWLPRSSLLCGFSIAQRPACLRVLWRLFLPLARVRLITVEKWSVGAFIVDTGFRLLFCGRLGLG